MPTSVATGTVAATTDGCVPQASEVAARERAEADVAKSIAAKERAEAEIATVTAQKEQAEAEAAKTIAELTFQLLQQQQSSTTGLADLKDRLTAANGELQRENEHLAMQLDALRTEQFDNIERAKEKEVAALKSKLVSAGDKIAALIKAKELLERGPDDEDEPFDDALQVRRFSEDLTLQRKHDIMAARSYTTATAAAVSVLAACAVGSLITLAYYVPTMPTTSPAPAGRRLLEVDDPTVVAWTKLALDLTAFVLVVILVCREYRNRTAPNDAPRGDPRGFRFRELQELLRIRDNMKEKQRLLRDRPDGEVVDDQRRRRSCWRALLLRLLEEHTDRPITPPIENGSVEDGMDSREDAEAADLERQDVKNAEQAHKIALEKLELAKSSDTDEGYVARVQLAQQYVNEVEGELAQERAIADVEARISDKLINFGFVTSTDGSAAVAIQLVQQYTLAGGNRTTQDMLPLVFIGALFVAALILDSIGVGVSGDAAAAFASATVSAGETCTITGDTLGGMVRAQH
eukprot:COSAG02_NODE_342_length_24167_cov_5.061118_7_plen_520_part_00